MIRFEYSPVRMTLAALLLAGCTVSETKDTRTDTAQLVPTTQVATPMSSDSMAMAGNMMPATPTSATTTPAMPAMPAMPAAQAAGLRVEVDLAARQLRLLDGATVVETHRVAVGSTKWPTQAGNWTIKQVVFNPEWTPPDESWAEEKEPRKSGDPKNPLGQAQLVYDPPRTVHGTNAPTSIGQAVSHGSIRMNNAEIVALGKKLLEATGAGKDAAWYAAAAKNKTTKQIVDLPTPVPIRVF